MSKVVYIPIHGDFYPATPPVDKNVHLSFGASSDYDLHLTSTGIYTLFTVEAPVLIKSIRARINTAFTNTMTMIVGDSDDTDGYFTDTDLAPGDTDGDYIWNIGSGAYVDGRSYTASQLILATIGTAACAAGYGEMIITYTELPQ